MATHSSIPAWRIPMDGGAWWATVHGVANSQTRLNDFIHSLTQTLMESLQKSSSVSHPKVNSSVFTNAFVYFPFNIFRDANI